MKSVLQNALRSAFAFAKRQVKSNSALRTLLYDTANMGQFASLDYQEVMLADPIRVNTYAEGLRRVVKPGDVIVDLGTGTGILAMLASRNKPRKIYALEHNNVIELAKFVADRNGIDCIEFVQKNSREFTSEEKVDLIIHEQIGDFLFEENMIENLLDLKARVLKSGGKIFPARFEFFLEPVCLKREYRVPFAWENNIHGIDYACLKGSEMYRKYSSRRNAMIRLQTGAIDYALCTPKPMLAFDLDRLGAKSDIPNAMAAEKVVTRAGAVDGISIYFKAIFDDDLSFDTALGSPHTHWEQPFFRIPRRDVKEGDVIRIKLDAQEIAEKGSWAITVE
jgi:protein arginine N-methyltransferase 1